MREAQRVVDLDDQRAARGVAPGRQRGGHVEHPHPGVVGAVVEPGVPAVDERKRRRVVDRPQPHRHVGHPVDRRQEAEHLHLGPGRGGDEGLDLERVGRPVVHPRLVDPVAGGRLRLAAVVAPDQLGCVAPLVVLAVVQRRDAGLDLPVVGLPLDVADIGPPGAVVELADELGVGVVVDDLYRAGRLVAPAGGRRVDAQRDRLGRRAVAEAAVDRVLGGDERGDRLAALGDVGELDAHHAGEVTLPRVRGQHTDGGDGPGADLAAGHGQRGGEGTGDTAQAAAVVERAEAAGEVGAAPAYRHALLGHGRRQERRADDVHEGTELVLGDGADRGTVHGTEGRHPRRLSPRDFGYPVERRASPGSSGDQPRRRTS